MIALVLIALLILVAAVAALTRRNLVHSALLLIGSWLGIAFFYLWAGAEFVAFAQVLVYVGAVSMVVLFAVLLTRRSEGDHVLAPESRTRAVSAVLVAGAVAALLVSAVLGSPLPAGQPAASAVSVRDIGLLLAGPHAIALLLAGVVLTVALVGAVVIASSDTHKGDAP